MWSFCATAWRIWIWNDMYKEYRQVTEGHVLQLNVQMECASWLLALEWLGLWIRKIHMLDKKVREIIHSDSIRFIFWSTMGGSSTLVRFNGCMSFIQSITCSLKLFWFVGNEDGAQFTTRTCVYINIFNDNHANKHYNYIFCLAILNMVIVFSRTVTSTLQ